MDTVITKRKAEEEALITKAVQLTSVSTTEITSLSSGKETTA